MSTEISLEVYFVTRYDIYDNNCSIEGNLCTNWLLELDIDLSYVEGIKDIIRQEAKKVEFFQKLGCITAISILQEESQISVKFQGLLYFVDKAFLVSDEHWLKLAYFDNTLVPMFPIEIFRSHSLIRKLSEIFNHPSSVLAQDIKYIFEENPKIFTALLPYISGKTKLLCTAVFENLHILDYMVANKHKMGVDKLNKVLRRLFYIQSKKPAGLALIQVGSLVLSQDDTRVVYLRTPNNGKAPIEVNKQVCEAIKSAEQFGDEDGRVTSNQSSRPAGSDEAMVAPDARRNQVSDNSLLNMLDRAFSRYNQLEARNQGHSGAKRKARI